LQDHAISDVNWDAGPVLSTEIFTASVVYDALSRPVTSTDPGGNITVPAYDKSGALVKVVLNGTEHVQNIKYDAKGQRQSILYGNNTVTKYTYDANTFRLKTLLTTGNSGATIYQGLNYYYDPVGNITTITDSAQQTLYFNNTVVSPTQKYTYDALYRLIKAQGRELIGTASFGTDDNTQDTAWKTTHKGDGNAVQGYTQNYTYDAVGNILTLQHIAGTGSYTRTFNIGTANNRLTSTVVGANTYNYTHDVRGNISVMPHLSTMGWNQQNELKNIARGTMSAWYQYSGGQRVRKYVNKAGIKEERIYLGNYEIYRKFDASSLKIVERITLHVSDDTGRIAMLENRTFGTAANDNNTAPSLIRYIYSNHLQSSSLELDGGAAIISYEEYHPYGTTSYQAMNTSIQAVAKRYRYTGKERDEESGLYYHGARYYIPWLCRWTACDPLESKYAGMSPYNYSFNNPIVWNDLNGADPGDEKRIPIAPTNDNMSIAQTPVPELYNGVPLEHMQGIGGNGDVVNMTVGYEPELGGFRVLKSELESATVIESEKKEKYGWWFLALSTDGSTTNLETVDYYENVMRGAFGVEMGFGEQSFVLSSDSHWHTIPKAWRNRSLNEAGSPEEVFNLVNSWENADVYASAYHNAEELKKIGENAQAGFMIGAAIGDLTNLRKEPIKINLSGTPALRAAYEAEVKGLSAIAEQMKAAGKSSEEIARALHGLRRELGVKYKSLTPNKLLQEIYQRNIQKYGDKLGPSIEYLRNQGKSWDDIINSATRSGGKDLKFK